jgi:hypothetical protein
VTKSQLTTQDDKANLLKLSKVEPWKKSTCFFWFGNFKGGRFTSKRALMTTPRNATCPSTTKAVPANTTPSRRHEGRTYPKLIDNSG